MTTDPHSAAPVKAKKKKKDAPAAAPPAADDAAAAPAEAAPAGKPGKVRGAWVGERGGSERACWLVAGAGQSKPRMGAAARPLVFFFRR